MSKICPITYRSLQSGEKIYSKEGLKQLSRQLKSLKVFPYTAQEQRLEAKALASRISIQGVQPKLSARLSVTKEGFEIVRKQGKYILKPQTADYLELPENEDLTMRLAESVGIETPFHGLLFCKDGSWTYFIKRMDRVGHKDKIALEDFSQLAEKYRETKYDYTIEKLIKLIDDYTTFPMLEKLKFYKRFLFNYIVGNEDMHLKNYSLIRNNHKVALSPAYDFVNSTIVLKNPREETALSLSGKKGHLGQKDLFVYLPKRLGLNDASVEIIFQDFQKGFSQWRVFLEENFLSKELQEKYKQLIMQRLERLEWKY